MADINALASSLGGMSPDQAQNAMGMAVQAMQNQQQLGLERDKLESLDAYRQGQLELLRSQEGRLRAKQQFDSVKETLALQLQKRAQDIQARMNEATIDKYSADAEMLRTQARALKSNFEKLEAMDSVMMKIPGTDDEIPAGVALQNNVFSDLIKQGVAASGLGADNLTADAKNFLFLTTPAEQGGVGLSDSEALARTYPDPLIGQIIKTMSGFNFQDPDEAFLSNIAIQVMTDEYRRSGRVLKGEALKNAIKNKVGGARQEAVSDMNFDVNIDTSQKPKFIE
jgi:hypothetical protein